MSLISELDYEYILKKLIVFSLLVIFSSLIILSVAVLINPSWLFTAVTDMLPIMIVGVIIIAIAGKILGEIE